jgi:hypothetical protein
MVDSLSSALLGRHELRGADDETFVRVQIRPLQWFSDAKIENQAAVVRSHQNVGRLDVSMDHPGFVGGVECFGYLIDDMNRALERPRFAVEQAPESDSTGYVFHHQVRTALVLSGVENGEDMRMVELTEQLGFLAKPPHPVRILTGLVEEDFDGDLTIESRMECFVNFRRASSPDESLEVIRAYLLSN